MAAVYSIEEKLQALHDDNFFNYFFFFNVTMPLTKCFLLPLSYQCLKLLLGRTLKNNKHNSVYSHPHKKTAGLQINNKPASSISETVLSTA